MNGQEADEETLKKAQGYPYSSEIDSYWVGPEGDRSEDWVGRFPAGVYAYSMEKLRALPLEPKRIGDRWNITANGKDYSAEGYATLTEVYKHAGRTIAVIKGSFKATWTNTSPGVEGPVTCTAKIDGYQCEVDLTTHMPVSETLTRTIEAKAGKESQTFTERETMTLIERQTLDNEKWQPGITEFARALPELDNPKGYTAAIKTIIAFADANPESPCGKAVAEQIVSWSGKHVGKRFFDITAMDNKGEWYNSAPLTKADIEGKVFLLEFWETKCGPCVTAAPGLSAIYKDFKNRGFVMVGVTHEGNLTREELEKDLKTIGITYPVFQDKGEVSLSKTFENTGFPHAFLVDRKGTIVWEGHPGEEKFMRELIEGVLGESAEKPNE